MYRSHQSLIKSLKEVELSFKDFMKTKLKSTTGLENLVKLKCKFKFLILNAGKMEKDHKTIMRFWKLDSTFKVWNTSDSIY